MDVPKIVKYDKAMNDELLKESPEIDLVRSYHHVLSEQAQLLAEQYDRMTALQATMKDMEFAQYRMAHEQRNTLHAMGAITQTLILQFSKMPSVSSSFLIPMLDKVAASGDPEPLKQVIRKVYDESGYQGPQQMTQNLSKLHSLVEVNKCVAEEYLDVKKIRSGNIQPNDDTFNVHEELNNIIEIVKMLTATDVVITLVGDNYEAIADSSRFHRCIMNILSNAVKACAKVRSPMIVISHVNEGDSIRVVIVDNGGGIPADVLARMHEDANPFVYVCRDATSTGLGLPIVRHTIEEVLRGTFHIDVCGSTTTVTITIPQSSESVKDLDIIPSTVKTILVVDDDAFILSVLENMLQSAGYVVYTACGVRAALELFNGDIQFHTVFSDLHMPPGEDGIELVTQIRHIETLNGKTAVTFVGLSGTSCTSITDKWRRAGLDLFYTKPLSMKHLPEVMGFVRKSYPDGFPIEFQAVDQDVMSLSDAWTKGVQNKGIYKKLMQSVLSHPLIPMVTSDDPKTPDADTLHHFLGIIAYLYAKPCAQVGKRVHVLLASEQDMDLLNELNLFQSEVKKLVKEINGVVM
jgi:signal transduction histidine kinase/response regulator of citrate/malate metabolism